MRCSKMYYYSKVNSNLNLMDFNVSKINRKHHRKRKIMIGGNQPTLNYTIASTFKINE